MPSPQGQDQAAEAIGLIPSGCCILTATAANESTGMLASWVQQAAFEPLMVTVAVKTGRPIEKLIQRSQRFTLNLLGEDPFALFKHFGGGFEPGEAAFEGLPVEDTPHGVELADALGWLSCSVAAMTPAGDHTVYLGRVESGRRRDGKPYVHLRKTGRSY